MAAEPKVEVGKSKLEIRKSAPMGRHEIPPEFRFSSFDFRVSVLDFPHFQRTRGGMLHQYRRGSAKHFCRFSL